MGVISTESPESRYIVVSLTVLVLNPIPAPSTFLSLASSPHFSHPYGICRHITTTTTLKLQSTRGLEHELPRRGAIRHQTRSQKSMVLGGSSTNSNEI